VCHGATFSKAERDGVAAPAWLLTVQVPVRLYVLTSGYI